MERHEMEQGGEREPMDAVQEITERIAAGESEDQLYKDYCDLAMILENRFLHQASIDACRKGLDAFPGNERLQGLLNTAQWRLDVAEGRAKPTPGQ
jgi:hypothetical protein